MAVPFPRFNWVKWYQAAVDQLVTDLVVLEFRLP